MRVQWNSAVAQVRELNRSKMTLSKQSTVLQSKKKWYEPWPGTSAVGSVARECEVKRTEDVSLECMADEKLKKGNL